MAKRPSTGKSRRRERQGPKGSTRQSATPTPVVAAEAPVEPLGPWLDQRRRAYPALAALFLFLALNPFADANLLALLRDGAAATGLALLAPWALGAALIAALAMALVGVGLFLVPRAERPLLHLGLALGLLFHALIHDLNPELAANPFLGVYDAVWGLPLAWLAPVLLALGLRQHKSGDARGLLVVVAVAVGLFAVTPWVHFGNMSFPALQLFVAGLTGGDVLATVFGLGFWLAAGLFALGAWSRRRAWVQGGGLALALILPLWQLVQALVQRQAILLSVAVATLLATALLVDVFLVLWTGPDLASGTVAAGAPKATLGSETPSAPRPVLSLLAFEGTALWSWVIPGVAFALFFLLKSHAFLPSTTDENIYFYMANLFAEGKLPYRDFFFAHPPLHVVIPGLVFALTGFKLLVAKFIPTLAAMASGYLVLRIGRKLGGPASGAVALILFFFATEVLKASTNMTGINLSAAFLILGVYLFLERRFLGAGLVFALGAHTGFYIIAAPVSLMALLALGDRRALLRLVMGFVPLWLGVFALCWGVGGESYLEGVFFYHWGKPAKVATMLPYVDGADPTQPLRALFHNLGLFFNAKMWRRTIYYQAHLFWGAFVALPYLFWTWKREVQERGQALAAWRFLDPRELFKRASLSVSGRGRILAYLLVVLIVEFSMFKELYEFYFVLMMPIAAALVGYLLGALARDLFLAAQGGSSTAWVPLTGIFAFILWIPVASHANHVFPDEFEQAGEIREYEYREPVILRPLAPIVRTLFWKDHRVKGEMELGLRHFMWNKTRYFSKAQEMADYVREHSAEGDTITGGSLVAPLVALLSGRDLAADIVDTNAKTFWSDMSLGRDFPDIDDPKERRSLIEARNQQRFFERVCETPLRFVVVAARTYFNPRRMQQTPTITRHFTRDRVFLDHEARHWKPARFALWSAKATGSDTCRYEPKATPPTR